MTLADLTIEQYKTIEALAVDYLNQMAMANKRGRSHPEAVASPPKLKAYAHLLEYGLTPDEAVAAFAEMCGQVDGVTA